MELMINDINTKKRINMLLVNADIRDGIIRNWDIINKNKILEIIQSTAQQVRLVINFISNL